MAQGDIKVYGVLHAETVEGIVARAAQVKDEAQGKTQSALNDEILSALSGKAAQESLTQYIQATNSSLQNLTQQLQSIATQNTTSEKEVVQVANESALESVSNPSGEVIYITLDQNKLFIYKDGKFEEITNRSDGNIIYVRSLNNLLDMEIARGMYSVCLAASSLAGSKATYLNLIVNSVSRRNGTSVTTMYLSDKEGWAEAVTEITPYVPATIYAYFDGADIYRTLLFDKADGWYSEDDPGRFYEVPNVAIGSAVTYNGMQVGTVNGYTEAIEAVAEKSWEWHYYAYQGESGETLELTEDSESELVFPIESEILQDIVNGEYDEDDVKMFSGTTQYVPMTSAEVQALVEVAMSAYNAAKESE